VIDAIYLACMSTGGFIAGFGLMLMIAEKLNGPVAWTRQARREAACYYLGTIALFWVICLVSAILQGPAA